MEHVDLLTLQRELKEGLMELFPDRIWVKAEIAALQVRTNGHCYLDLVQNEKGVQKAKARAVCWGSYFPMLSAMFRSATGANLAAGQQVLVRVQVSYSEVYGLSLVIDDINPEFTIGNAELEKRQTIERLTAEGFMDKQKALTLSPLPYRLAVVSAPDAAGYGDFCRHLAENAYGFVFETQLFEATMQGEKSPASVADALEAVECSEKPFDAVLIMRGGGSALDLACFDDYGMALAIAQCPVPVFTAIGHDRDHHVADMVAFASVKTPTALADEFISLYVDEDERICSLGQRLKLAFSSKIAMRLAKVEELQRRIVSADPRNILKRGYTLVTSESGVVVKSAASLKEGDLVNVMLADGTVVARVEKKK